MDKNEFSSRVLEAEATLYHVAKSILHQEQDCEDAVQSAVLSAWQSLPALRQPEYFKTWLVRILLRECYALQKKRVNAAPQPEEWENRLPDPRAEGELHRGEVRTALDALPQKLRLCMVLYYMDGYTVQEISAILRLPAGTVKSRLARGRAGMKESLSPAPVLINHQEVAYENV